MQFLRNFIGELPDDFRILSYTKKAAEIHAEIRVQVEKMGRPADGKLAGVKKTASPRWRKPSARVCERKTLTVVLLFYKYIDSVCI